MTSFGLMKQASLGLNLNVKKTHKQAFLDQVARVVPWGDLVEKCKTGVLAGVDHPFRVIKRQFGCVLVRDRGLKKNTLQLKTLFALSNLWIVRHKLMGAKT